MRFSFSSPRDHRALAVVRKANSRDVIQTREKSLWVTIDDLDKNDEKFDAGDPGWQTIDIAEARDDVIMPISFEAKSR
jgi:hypothetical protein